MSGFGTIKAGGYRYRKSAKIERVSVPFAETRGLGGKPSRMDGRFWAVTLTDFCTFAMSQSVSLARMRTHVILNLALQFSKSVPCPLSRLRDRRTS